MTILQSLNYNWKLHRGGRITASNFHEVCHKKVDDEENQNSSSLLNKLMLYTTKPNVPAITCGQIKVDRKYYYQIQGQMFILNLDYCDFFIWSPATFTDHPSYLKPHVEKNDKFIHAMFVKLQNYFFKVLLPEVVICKNNICADNKHKYYCICRRPYFEPMIACDAKHCDIEWYHYTCVNIKIAPKGPCFCENCTAKNKIK